MPWLKISPEELRFGRKMPLRGKKVWNIVYFPRLLASVLLYPVEQANVHVVLNPNPAFHFSIIFNITRLTCTPFIILNRDVEESLKFTMASGDQFNMTLAIILSHVVVSVVAAVIAVIAVKAMQSSGEKKNRESTGEKIK